MRLEVEALLAELLDGDATSAWARVSDAYRRGVSAFLLLERLLGRVARRLEQLWARDERTSLEVAMATCQLRTLAQHLVSDVVVDAPEPRPTAVTWTPRGDRVGFGSMLHECCLELQGWHVERYDGLPARDVLDRIRASGVDLLLCVVDDARLLAGTCRGLRHFKEASTRRELAVIAAGRAFEGCSGNQDCPVSGFSGSAEDTLELAQRQRQVA